jgi:NAD(P)-dependent dehydrogenase (short-subunit alcohol dehydrogenase family)
MLDDLPWRNLALFVAAVVVASFAKEWGRYAVTVNAVAFGYIQTRLTKPLNEGEDRNA